MKVLSINNCFNNLSTFNNVGKKVSAPIKSVPSFISIAAASAITAAALVKPVKNEITVNDICNRLNNFDFSKNEKKEDLIKFKAFINLDKKTGKELYNGNFRSLYETFSVLNKNGAIESLFKQGNRGLNLVSDYIKNHHIKKEDLENLIAYKKDAYSSFVRDMQASLVEKSKNKDFEINNAIQEKINSISSVLEKNVIPEGTKLYRVENARLNLDNIKLKNGMIINLGKGMVNAAKTNNAEEIAKIEECVLDNDIRIINPRFMSTSLNDNIDETFGKQVIKSTPILWEFTTKQNTKGLYLESFNTTGQYADQNEVLIQKDSQIIFKSAKYDEKTGVWHIKADLENKDSKDIFENITSKFEEIGYKQNEFGYYIKQKIFSKNIDLLKQFGIDGIYYKKILTKPLQKKDVEDFKNFVILGKENGKHLYETNFEQLFTIYSILKNSNCLSGFMEQCNKNQDNFKLIDNLIKNPIDKETFKSLSKYKGKSYEGTGLKIQESLREADKRENYKINSKIQKHIDNISQYIDTQVLPDNIKLYRGERCHGSLMNVKTSNDEKINLGHMMFKAAESGNKNEINKIKEFVLNNELSVKIPAFMSTSTDKNTGKDFSLQYSINDRVVWDLDVEPKSKGMFIEGIYANGHFKKQNEVLIQKNSIIKIKDVVFDNEKGLWIIKGKVLN